MINNSDVINNITNWPNHLHNIWEHNIWEHDCILPIDGALVFYINNIFVLHAS